MNLQIFIISWDGQHDNACSIAAALLNVGANVQIVFSDPNPLLDLNTTVVSNRRPNHLFFGDKFQACLDAFDADQMLVIHADCQCLDWPKLVFAAEAALKSQPKIWMWAPLIQYTGFGIERTRILDLRPSNLIAVAHTDTIVFAIARPVVERLRGATLVDNVFGWGIGWLASAFTYLNQHLVVVDPEISVSHPKSRAYPTQAAEAQREQYLKQLTISEALQCRLLSSHMAWQGSRSASSKKS